MQVGALGTALNESGSKKNTGLDTVGIVEYESGRAKHENRSP
jgi:hypothetical protein